MAELPSGTVSLLFSDIEGSTVLLSRLGRAYADALDGQRRVLRRAWSEHGGVELGTEGDSFMVVFATAEGAVAAAAQAQRELAGFDWPAGEQVRVRMGIHTGTPTVHDGGYVGMDVHLAARVAGAAHGGQVLVSQATAGLVGQCLPGGVAVKDLGSHQLKDIAHPERLFQLVIDGLRSDFPPLKTLGAASSLPRPATLLVGRKGELSELSALLRSPEVRLVTLTGPGGSGKTRLAIALARVSVERFPDGVFFVPLAAVTDTDVMWTSIAEVLDVPPEGRIPPGLFEHVAHRYGLLVLDNLEQIDGADNVVAQLLEAAPQLVVIATTRRPLHLPAEHEHPVPPLELPANASMVEVEGSGAVQMFVQHARKVRRDFELTASNAAELGEVCRRLDGLPLAIELAAARSKLLSPAALLARLDKALDIAASGRHAPSRQKTLRDTISWSYDLLDSTQQAFFRRLSVFAGGADLDAVSTATADILDGADPLDLVADLVDASMTTIGENAGGDPRVAMLVTIRAYAHDQLRAAGELDDVRRSHALHYLAVAQKLRAEMWGSAEKMLSVRRRFEVELDNIREALGWALPPDDSGTLSPEQLRVGLQLGEESGPLWRVGGYYAEARRWYERAISRAGNQDSPQLAGCLDGLAHLTMISQADFARARDAATRSVAMCQRLNDEHRLGHALLTLSIVASLQDEIPAARAAIEQAVVLAEENGDQPQLARLRARSAFLELMDGNVGRSIELYNTAIALFLELGDQDGVLNSRYNMTWALRKMGRLEESHRQLRELLPQLLQLAEPEWLAVAAEDYGAVLAELGDHHRAAKLLGAAEAMRERNSTPRDPNQQTEIEEPYNRARTALGDETWERENHAGRNMTVEAALTEAHAADSPG